MEQFRLDGKVSLVTGSGRGLGRAIAHGLAAAGAEVLVNGRNPDPVAETVEQIRAAGGCASPLCFDIANETASAQAFETCEREFGGLDVLVNNAGVRDRRPALAFDLAAARALLEVDLVAPFNLCRQAAPLMMKRRAGAIINITSIAGPLASGQDAVYTAAKGGLEALTRALAAEFGSSGITVNAVAPGFFATEFNADMVENPGIEQWLRDRSCLKRWGQPEEIAGAVVFLASPAASYVSGHLLAVDGGYLSHM